MWKVLLGVPIAICAIAQKIAIGHLCSSESKYERESSKEAMRKRMFYSSEILKKNKPIERSKLTTLSLSNIAHIIQLG